MRYVRLIGIITVDYHCSKEK